MFPDRFLILNFLLSIAYFSPVNSSSTVKVRKIFLLTIKILLFTISAFYLYFKSKNISWEGLHTILDSSSYQLLTLSLLLMPFHIMLEASKWKLLLSKSSNIQFLQSFKAVCMGVSFGFITPGRIGDIVGRLFDLRKDYRWKGAVASIFNGMAQTIPTALFGFIAAVFVFIEQPSIVSLITGLFSVLIAILYFICLAKPDQINGILLQVWNWLSLPDLKHGDVKNADSVDPQVLLLSFFRYLIFFVQFYLVLQTFKCPLPIKTLLLIIPFYFAIITLIPSFFLGKLGIRESVLIFLLLPFWDNTLAILAASLSIWIINQLIPAIMGWLFILKKK